jgi:hypothetical protein
MVRKMVEIGGNNNLTKLNIFRLEKVRNCRIWRGFKIENCGKIRIKRNKKVRKC